MRIRWIAVVLVLGTASAWAGSRADAFAARRGAFQDREKAAFLAADKDGNGALSPEEAGALPRVARRFKELDANEDGELTWDEAGGETRRSKAGRSGAFRSRQGAVRERDTPPPPLVQP